MLYKHTATDQGCPACRGNRFKYATFASNAEMEWAIREGFDPRDSGLWEYFDDE